MDSLMQKIQVTTEIPELLSVLKYVKGPTWFFPSNSKSKREKMEKRKFTHTSKLWCDYFKMYFFFLTFLFSPFFYSFLIMGRFSSKSFLFIYSYFYRKNTVQLFSWNNILKIIIIIIYTFNYLYHFFFFRATVEK